MLQAIVGIEIPITRIEGKWKVSQNRPPARRKGVAEGLGGDGDSGRAMASLIVARARQLSSAHRRPVSARQRAGPRRRR